MKRECKLPIETKPIVQCYHNMAFPLSVIQGNAKVLGKDAFPWFVDKYLNCKFEHTPSDNKFEMCTYDTWGTKEGVVSDQFLSLHLDLYTKLGVDILEGTKTVLSEGHYIFGMYNEKYIPGKDAYRRYNYSHDYLLYGYNDNKRVIYSIGYLANKKYMPFEIPYENFVESIRRNPLQQSELYFFQYNPLFEYKTDIAKIVKGLMDYIQSTNYLGVTPKYSYGITAVKKLREYIQITASRENVPRIDDRYTRAHEEQKYLTMRCAEYLQKEKQLPINSSDIEMIENIYQKANMIHMLAIKFNIVPDNTTLKGIDDAFQYILDRGIEPLSNIVDRLTYI